MTRNRSLINENILRSTIDFSSIIRKRQSRNRACKDWSVEVERSDISPLTGRCKRLCRVFPVMTYAAMLVGRLKLRVLLSIHYSKLLEPSTGSEESYSLSYTSCPINLKKKLRRLQLINRKLLSVLIHYSIIELLLFCIEASWRRSCIYNLVNRVFSSDSIQDTGRMIVSIEEYRPIEVTVYILVAQVFRNVHVGKIIPRPLTCQISKPASR
jgi:hypothetical protein